MPGVSRQRCRGAPSWWGSCCAPMLVLTAGSGFALLPASEPLPASRLYPCTLAASLVAIPGAEAVEEMDAVKFSSCVLALPLNGSALCSLPMNMNSSAEVCC